jgi:hypothetical protein
MEAYSNGFRDGFEYGSGIKSPNLPEVIENLKTKIEKEE